MILSAGTIPLLEDIIVKSNAYESATALYLNLSCLEEAKAIIGSSQALPFLVQLLEANTGTQCKLDALHALYNLSTHSPNIPLLLAAGIVERLQVLLTANAGSADHTWAEKSIAVLINIASSKPGKREIISTPGLIAGLASVLETGEPIEQEQAISCLLILCRGDDKCGQLVLQEGVIPSLVSVSTNGTVRGREKAQKLLMLFREQRQREPSPVRMLQWAESSSVAPENKPLYKSTPRKVGRALSFIWRSKHLSVYQC